MTETIAIGVDIGGTKIALAAASQDGRILAQDVVPTHPAEGSQAVIARLARGIENLIGAVGYKVKIAGIGVACPGPVDPVRGVALNAVNLAWKDVPLRDLLRANLALTAPILLANDVNAGALGEMHFGAARGVRDFVHITVGTGLGGAAILDGRILNGVSGSAMEIGHVSLDPRGRLCACGTRGCVETVASGKGLLAGVNEYVAAYPGSPLASADPLTTSAILEAARAGDPLARRVLDEAGIALGTTLAWCATLLDPALIVVGGGLTAAAGDLFWEAMIGALEARVLSSLRTSLRVARSEVESTALGAAALVWGA
ncbi:MAG: ROK family protein [Chloroflexota bacterium]|nr:ROK family protein [Chloroflexota bacterium]